MNVHIIYEIAKHKLKVFHALLWNKEFREFIEGNNGYWRDQFIKLHIETEHIGLFPSTKISVSRIKFNGKYHSIDDLPSVVFRGDGGNHWYRHGKRHRGGDLPAVIDYNGDQEWWEENNLHRDGDEPAVIHANGRREW